MTLLKTGAVCAALIMAACSGESATFEGRSDEVTAGNSGCATVKFNVQLVPTSAFTAVGQVTGDLQGTVQYVFDASSLKFAGATIQNSGTASWTITGGVLGPLSFETAFENMNINVDRPGSPATQFENNGTHRAVAGVSKANLTYHGTFTVVPAPVGSHDYQGVICV